MLFGPFCFLCCRFCDCLRFCYGHLTMGLENEYHRWLINIYRAIEFVLLISSGVHSDKDIVPCVDMGTTVPVSANPYTNRRSEKVIIVGGVARAPTVILILGL